jgi:predicted ArsR family transcriptional regulator
MEKENVNETLALGCILLHPIIYQIVRALKEKQKLYINELEGIIGINRKVISFHLSTLSQYGFVEGNYEVLKIPHSDSKGKAVKYFKLTHKVDDVLDVVCRSLRYLKFDNCV